MAGATCLPAGVEFVEGELADRPPRKSFHRRAERQASLSTACSTLPRSLRPANRWCARRFTSATTPPRPSRCLRRCWPADRAAGLFLHCRRLRRAGIRSDSGRCAPRADQRLRRVQAAGGADARLVQSHSRPALRFAALLQRGRRAGGSRGHHPRRSARARVAPDSAGSRCCAGPARVDPHLRRRLPHARRHLHSRLHPRLRPGRRAPAGALGALRMPKTTEDR